MCGLCWGSSTTHQMMGSSRTWPLQGPSPSGGEGGCSFMCCTSATRRPHCTRSQRPGMHTCPPPPPDRQQEAPMPWPCCLGHVCAGSSSVGSCGRAELQASSVSLIVSPLTLSFLLRFFPVEGDGSEAWGGTTTRTRQPQPMPPFRDGEHSPSPQGLSSGPSFDLWGCQGFGFAGSWS